MSTLLAQFKDPRASWFRFKIGLAVFAVAVAMMMLTDKPEGAVKWAILITLTIGFVTAMSGYLGIFLQRISRFKEIKQRTRSPRK